MPYGNNPAPYRVTLHKLNGETIADYSEEFFLPASAEKAAIRESRSWGSQVVARVTGPNGAHTYRMGRRYKLFN